MPETVRERDALYYPYIHLRNEAWLRGALLFFPHILRMVPHNHYMLRDTDFVSELAETQGRRGAPLVGCFPLNSGVAYSAGRRLASRFANDPDAGALERRFGRRATTTEFGEDRVFEIHKDKFAFALEDKLRELGLMWSARSARGDWIAVHPTIGEVVMSTVAVAVARHRGCDILADTRRTHLATATDDEGAIYDRLLGRVDRDRLKETELHEVGELLFAATFDLSSLKPADYAALSEEREALFDFKTLLADRASRIPAMADEGTRMAMAREAADCILSEWEKKRRTWGNFVKRMLRIDTAGEAKDTAVSLLTDLGMPAIGGGVAIVATGNVLLGAVPGLAVGLTLYGAKVWRDLGEEERHAPTHFLSLVASQGGVLSAPAR